MDTAYITWLILMGGGAILALFVRPKHIVIAGAALMACSLVGLVASSMLGGGNLTTIFGVATMAIPVVFGMLAIGSAIGTFFKNKIRGSQNGGS